jgi:hypothetical protein
MNVNDAEKQLDAFTARANDAASLEPDDVATQVSDDDVIDAKVRQASKGSKLATSVVQKRTTLNESQLEKSIAASLHKYPDIQEIELRQNIADHLDKNNDAISESDYAQIVNRLVVAQEKQQPLPGGVPLLTPPAIWGSSVSGIQTGATRLADRASALSTPGGVGFLVFVLLFLIWVIVPVSNGKTRLQLLWGVLTNQVYFPDDVQGASGDFSTGASSGASGNFSVGGGNVGNVSKRFDLPYVPIFDEY